MQDSKIQWTMRMIPTPDQIAAARAQYPDVVLFFDCGDGVIREERQNGFYWIWKTVKLRDLLIKFRAYGSTCVPLAWNGVTWVAEDADAKGTDE